MVLPLKLPLGTSEFRKFRQSDTYYADKTDLIRELIDLPQDAVLFPRPRRFGKTTNLSMLRAFFGKHSEDLSGLFAGLAIWQAAPSTAPTSDAIRSSRCLSKRSRPRPGTSAVPPSPSPCHADLPSMRSCFPRPN
jgi:hypothetical protein